MLLLLFNYKKHAACFSSFYSFSSLLLLTSKLAAGRSRAQTRAASPIKALSPSQPLPSRELEAHTSEMTVRDADVFRHEERERASLSGSQHLQDHGQPASDKRGGRLYR